MRIDQFLSICALFLVILFSGSLVTASSPIFSTQEYRLLKLSDVPVIKSASTSASLQPQLSAASAVVFDSPSMTKLYGKNEEIARYPASVTKLMTGLIALENYDLNLELIVSDEVLIPGNKSGLTKGEKIMVRDALKALLISSGNDMAYLLANNFPEGQDGFLRVMNQKAREMGLTDTYFVNPAGLDQLGQTSSARDLALLIKEVSAKPYLASILGTKQTTISEDGQIFHTLYNTNYLIHADTQVIMGKTGTTDLAGEVLVTIVSHQGREIIVVVMGSQDRYQDTVNLIDWTFQNYSWVSL